MAMPKATRFKFLREPGNGFGKVWVDTLLIPNVTEISLTVTKHSCIASYTIDLNEPHPYQSTVDTYLDLSEAEEISIDGQPATTLMKVIPDRRPKIKKPRKKARRKKT